MTGTWDDERGPMVEPPPDVELGQRARDVLARLDQQAARVLEVQGKHVSDRLAREAAERRDRIEASHAVSSARDWRAYTPRPIDQVQRERATVHGDVDERLLALYRRDDDAWLDREAALSLDVQEQVQ